MKEDLSTTRRYLPTIFQTAQNLAAGGGNCLSAPWYKLPQNPFSVSKVRSEATTRSDFADELQDKSATWNLSVNLNG